MVKDGEYHIPQAKGLPPGTYHVEINSPDTKAPLVAVREAGRTSCAPYGAGTYSGRIQHEQQTIGRSMPQARIINLNLIS